MTQPMSQSKLAVLIGNQSYVDPGYQGLLYTRSDAEALGARLATLGFDVVVAADATYTKLEELLTRISGWAPPPSEIFFFFAGHGERRGGDNVLLPVDAMQRGDTALALNDVLDACAPSTIQGSRRVDIVLDCCQSQGQGMERKVRYPRRGEYVVLFACGAGRVATEGMNAIGSEGLMVGHGYLTCALLQHCGEDLYHAFPAIASSVRRATRNLQTPWMLSNVCRHELQADSEVQLASVVKNDPAISLLRQHLRLSGKIDAILNPFRRASIWALEKYVVLDRMFLVGDVEVPHCRIADPHRAERARLDKLSGLRVEVPSVIVISHTAYGGSPQCLESFLHTGIMQHYLIDRSGHLMQFVDTELRAWHAGVACWRPVGAVGSIAGHLGVNDVNSHSIGITLDGNGCHEEFTVQQYATLNALLALLRDRYSISGRNVVGLGEVAHPPGRHQAPGVHFDWDRLECFGADFPSRRRVRECQPKSPQLSILGGDANSRPLAPALIDWGYSCDEDKAWHAHTRMQIAMDRYLGTAGMGHGGNIAQGHSLLAQMFTFRSQCELRGSSHNEGQLADHMSGDESSVTDVAIVPSFLHDMD